MTHTGLKRVIRKNKKRIIAINGCFDILHIGHIKLFKAAKKLGHKIIVGINSDNSIKKIKGPTRPINNQRFRKEMLLSLKYIDKVIIFNEENALKFLQKVKPDIWVKGGDYSEKTVNRQELNYLKKINCKTIFIPHYKNQSTSNIIERI